MATLNTNGLPPKEFASDWHTEVSSQHESLFDLDAILQGVLALVCLDQEGSPEARLLAVAIEKLSEINCAIDDICVRGSLASTPEVSNV